MRFLFAIVWGVIVAIILMPFGITVSDGIWWISMIALNIFGNFFLAPVLIKEEEDLK